MLEKPPLPDSLLLARVRDEYGLPAARLEFLPLGADVNTAVYRLEAEDDSPYFLKIRKGAFDEIAVTVPQFLAARVTRSIIAPLPTRYGSLWGSLDPYKLILYPYIEGQDGFEVDLTAPQRIELGRDLRRIHTAPLPPEIKGRIPRETYGPFWREMVKNFQQQVEHTCYVDAPAEELAAEMSLRKPEIDFMIHRAEELGRDLQVRPRQFVLCHTDLHGANLLITPAGPVYIVDWDAPLLAPKERDLMFIGGRIDYLWETDDLRALFYEGYGPVEVDQVALAYYRYERIIEDLAAYADQLLSTAEGGADRESGVRRFANNFRPGAELDVARATDPDR